MVLAKIWPRLPMVSSVEKKETHRLQRVSRVERIGFEPMTSGLQSRIGRILSSTPQPEDAVLAGVSFERGPAQHRSTRPVRLNLCGPCAVPLDARNAG
jgi:hypothetical protein